MTPFKAEEIFAKRDNPVREVIDAVSPKVGLNFIVNAMMNGVTKEETEHLGLRYASDPQEALEMAFEIKGPGAKIAVLRQAGDTLPIINEMG